MNAARYFSVATLVNDDGTRLYEYRRGMQRAFPTLVSQNIRAASDFYRQLFDLNPNFESDWFISLASPAEPMLELGFISETSESAVGPASPGSGICLTFVVEDVELTVKKALELGAEQVEAPRNLFYGQRRALLRDPDGRVIDVSSECPPDPEWMARVEPNGSGGYREV